jgi:hypothetical protein
MELTIKNLKMHQTQDGHAFTCTCYIDGEKAFTVEQDGWGGENFYFPIKPGDLKLLDAVQEHAKTLPPVVNPFGDPLPCNLDLWLEEVINQYLEDKEFKRKCKKKTLFRLKADKEGTYWTSNEPYSTAYADHLRRKYGDALVEIINERYL